MVNQFHLTTAYCVCVMAGKIKTHSKDLRLLHTTQCVFQTVEHEFLPSNDPEHNVKHAQIILLPPPSRSCHSGGAEENPHEGRGGGGTSTELKPPPPFCTDSLV